MAIVEAAKVTLRRNAASCAVTPLVRLFVSEGSRSFVLFSRACLRCCC